MKSIDDLVAILQKSDNASAKARQDDEAVQSYTKTEMEHIGVLLQELKTGFTE